MRSCAKQLVLVYRLEFNMIYWSLKVKYHSFPSCSLYLQFMALRNTATDFGSPEVDKNGNISVYRLPFFLMMVSIDRSRRALSIDILTAKN